MEKLERTLLNIFLEGNPKCAVDYLYMLLGEWEAMSKTRVCDRGRKEGKVDMNADAFPFRGSKSARLLSHCFGMTVQKSPFYP